MSASASRASQLVHHARARLNSSDPRSGALAVALLQKAVEHAPADPDLRCELAWAYHKQAMYEEAREAARAALELNPGSLRGQLNACMLNLPAVYKSQDEVGRARTRYLHDLDKLLLAAREAEPAELAACVPGLGLTLPFYLPYQGDNLRVPQMAFGEVLGRIAAAYFGHSFPHRLETATRPERQRIRIGFVSAAFFSHSAWHVVLKGWLENLCTKTFELVGYDLSKQSDSETEVARRLLSRLVSGPKSLKAWRQDILDDQPDVLIYPEIGTNWPVTLLASLRLAPVQCTGWGYFATSGLETIDYFISGAQAEPADASEHYSETLVCLPKLSVTYNPTALDPDASHRADFGLRETSIVYYCGQTTRKYLPKYDDLYPRIARLVGDCQFVFLEDRNTPRASGLFRERLSAAFAARGLDAGDHALFVPILRRPTFQRLIQLADVYLDSIEISGVTTTLEVLAYGTPIVTFAGDYLRGRLGLAVLDIMGLSDIVARSVDEYVDIAASLGQSDSRRRAISRAIVSNRRKVYGDTSYIAEMQEFLTAAVYAAREERLG